MNIFRRTLVWIAVYLLATTFAVVVGVSYTKAYGDTRTIPVSGHRFATNVYEVPEQSLTALAYATGAGVHAVEADVHFTKDNYMVLTHDLTLDRTTNCTGMVEAKTFTQLRTCANWDIVPSLTNALKRTKAYGIYFNIEVKPIPGYPLTNSQIGILTRRVAKYGMTKKVVYSSTSTTYLARIKANPTSAGSRFARISPGLPVSPSTARKSGTVYMPKYYSLTKESVAQYHEAGISVWAWPGRSALDYALMRELGVNVIVADDPKKATTFLRDNY